MTLESLKARIKALEGHLKHDDHACVLEYADGTTRALSSCYEAMQLIRVQSIQKHIDMGYIHTVDGCTGSHYNVCWLMLVPATNEIIDIHPDKQANTHLSEVMCIALRVMFLPRRNADDEFHTHTIFEYGHEDEFKTATGLSDKDINDIIEKINERGN